MNPLIQNSVQQDDLLELYPLSLYPLLYQFFIQKNIGGDGGIIVAYICVRKSKKHYNIRYKSNKFHYIT